MPTLRELQDVLDWQAVATLREVDELEGASASEVTDRGDLDAETVENRLQQLVAVGLLNEVESDDGTLYEVTGAGHGAIGAGLYDEFDMNPEDIDALAGRFADLLDRRDAIRADLESLREAAQNLQREAQREFEDREDVGAEFESLLEDIDALADALDDD
jgi:uncharacterized protein YukE